MNDDIITINLGVYNDDSMRIAIDRSQTSVLFVADGIISGALKSNYLYKNCKKIALFLAVCSGLKKSGVMFERDDIRYIELAGRILDAVKSLFKGFEDYDFEVKRCCRLIIDQLETRASGNAFNSIHLLEID